MVEALMNEQQASKTKAGEPNQTFDRVGFFSLKTDDGWMVFFRPHLCLELLPEWKVKKGDLSAKMTAWQAFTEGVGQGIKLCGELDAVTAEFTCLYCHELLEAGYTVHWRARAKFRLNDGSVVGPAVAVFMMHTEERDGLRTKRMDAENREAIELGNKMNFTRNGIRVTVTKLEYGILSGGPVYDAMLSDRRADEVEDVLLEEEIASIQRSAARQKRLLEACVEAENKLRASPAFQMLSRAAQRKAIDELREQSGVPRDAG